MVIFKPTDVWFVRRLCAKIPTLMLIFIKHFRISKRLLISVNEFKNSQCSVFFKCSKKNNYFSYKGHVSSHEPSKSKYTVWIYFLFIIIVYFYRLVHMTHYNKIYNHQSYHKEKNKNVYRVAPQGKSQKAKWRLVASVDWYRRSYHLRRL